MNARSRQALCLVIAIENGVLLMWWLRDGSWGWAIVALIGFALGVNALRTNLWFERRPPQDGICRRCGGGGCPACDARCL